LPDSVFVEDTALVLDEIAIITRPGAASRQPETTSIAQALHAYRPLAFIQAPGTLDGGDILRVGRQIFVGLSSRSNPAAIEQLRTHVDPYGYTVQGVPMQDCLHLKTAVTQVAPNTLLINRAWVDAGAFDPFDLIDVDTDEPFAANALLIGNTILYPLAFPRTRQRLEQRAIPLKTVDVSELAKAEGAVTCCSLIFAKN
jgi:dimethylargininase